MRSWAEIRKAYVSYRVDELTGTSPPRGYIGNWRQYRKDQAHREFNEFVQEEKAKAVREYIEAMSQ